MRTTNALLGFLHITFGFVRRISPSSIMPLLLLLFALPAAVQAHFGTADAIGNAASFVDPASPAVSRASVIDAAGANRPRAFLVRRPMLIEPNQGPARGNALGDTATESRSRQAKR